MKTLRVFFVLHERNKGEITYKKTRTHQDFDHQDPDKAYVFIRSKYGEMVMDRNGKAPDCWASIHSHTFVDLEREKPVIESDKTYEVPLFDALTLKNCLQDSPRLKEKQRKGPF